MEQHKRLHRFLLEPFAIVSTSGQQFLNLLVFFPSSAGKLSSLTYITLQLWEKNELALSHLKKSPMFDLLPKGLRHCIWPLINLRIIFSSKNITLRMYNNIWRTRRISITDSQCFQESQVHTVCFTLDSTYRSSQKGQKVIGNNIHDILFEKRYLITRLVNINNSCLFCNAQELKIENWSEPR